MATLQVIDDSNRSAHSYLTPNDTCYFLHEYSAREGPKHSPPNQFIFNFKKPINRRGLPEYVYKTKAIEKAIADYRQLFSQWPETYLQATFVPMPPSKLPSDPEYDDRMWQVVNGLCKGKDADARELITQTHTYTAAHLHKGGQHRIKPDELRAIYQLNGPPPKDTVLLFDDVLSAGTHFIAAKSKIQATYPNTTVIGFFLARRVFPDVTLDFSVV